MTAHPLTPDDVVRTLGEIDDSTIAEVIATGATSAELALALEQLRSDSRSWTRRAQSEGRVGAVYEILEPWWQSTEEPEYAATD